MKRVIQHQHWQLYDSGIFFCDLTGLTGFSGEPHAFSGAQRETWKVDLEDVLVSRLHEVAGYLDRLKVAFAKEGAQIPGFNVHLRLTGPLRDWGLDLTSTDMLKLVPCPFKADRNQFSFDHQWTDPTRQVDDTIDKILWLFHHPPVDQSPWVKELRP